MTEGGMAGAMRPAYRPDIDGLRAVAVTGVVLAHAGVPHLAGGILGVDVFSSSPVI
jgi:peptidoglycan/LPS O-acetylase OafA/YrhL